MTALASETKIQQAIVQYLDRALPATYRFFAIPNGGARSAITGARLKREGVKRGIPDICIVRQGGTVAFIEVKTSKGRASKEQNEFIDWCGEGSVPVAIVRGVGDVEAALLDWNIPVRARASA